MRESDAVEALNRRISVRALAIGLGLGLLPIGAVLVASRVADFTVSDATRDAIDVLGAPTYVGFVSNLGAVIWVVAATSCLLAAAVIARTGASLPDVRFLTATGLLTSLAAADDMFLIHERAITPIAGGSEAAYAAVWAGLLVAYLAVAGRSLLRYWSPLLVVVAVLFIASIGIDVLAPLTDAWTFVEDSAKYVGIVFWAVYVVPLAYGLVLASDSMSRGRPDPDD